jgi:hypothetical protein
MRLLIPRSFYLFTLDFLRLKESLKQNNKVNTDLRAAYGGSLFLFRSEVKVKGGSVNRPARGRFRECLWHSRAGLRPATEPPYYPPPPATVKKIPIFVYIA